MYRSKLVRSPVNLLLLIMLELIVIIQSQEPIICFKNQTEIKWRSTIFGQKTKNIPLEFDTHKLQRELEWILKIHEKLIIRFKPNPRNTTVGLVETDPEEVTDITHLQDISGHQIYGSQDIIYNPQQIFHLCHLLGLSNISPQDPFLEPEVLINLIERNCPKIQEDRVIYGNYCGREEDYIGCLGKIPDLDTFRHNAECGIFIPLIVKARGLYDQDQRFIERISLNQRTKNQEDFRPLLNETPYRKKLSNNQANPHLLTLAGYPYFKGFRARCIAYEGLASGGDRTSRSINPERTPRSPEIKAPFGQQQVINNNEEMEDSDSDQGEDTTNVEQVPPILVTRRVNLTNIPSSITTTKSTVATTTKSTTTTTTKATTTTTKPPLDQEMEAPTNTKVAEPALVMPAAFPGSTAPCLTKLIKSRVYCMDRWHSYDEDSLAGLGYRNGVALMLKEVKMKIQMLEKFLAQISAGTTIRCEEVDRPCWEFSLPYHWKKTFTILEELSQTKRHQIPPTLLVQSIRKRIKKIEPMDLGIDLPYAVLPDSKLQEMVHSQYPDFNITDPIFTITNLTKNQSHLGGQINVQGIDPHSRMELYDLRVINTEGWRIKAKYLVNLTNKVVALDKNPEQTLHCRPMWTHNELKKICNTMVTPWEWQKDCGTAITQNRDVARICRATNSIQGAVFTNFCGLGVKIVVTPVKVEARQTCPNISYMTTFTPGLTEILGECDVGEIDLNPDGNSEDSGDPSFLESLVGYWTNPIFCAVLQGCCCCGYFCNCCYKCRTGPEENDQNRALPADIIETRETRTAELGWLGRFWELLRRMRGQPLEVKGHTNDQEQGPLLKSDPPGVNCLSSDPRVPSPQTRETGEDPAGVMVRSSSYAGPRREERSEDIPTRKSKSYGNLSQTGGETGHWMAASPPSYSRAVSITSQSPKPSKKKHKKKPKEKIVFMPDCNDDNNKEKRDWKYMVPK